MEHMTLFELERKLARMREQGAGDNTPVLMGIMMDGEENKIYDIRDVKVSYGVDSCGSSICKRMVELLGSVTWGCIEEKK